MSRAALAALVLALAAGASTGGGASASPSTDVRTSSPQASRTANAAGVCAVWRKHSKRVVVHVKRGGQWKRVVRVKRWRTCAKRVAPTGPAIVELPAPAPEPQPEPEDPTIPRLGIKAVEWSYTLSRPEVPAGEVIVELNNMGEDPHNLNLQFEDGSGPELSVSVTGPAGQSKAKFDLPAGSYRLWCDLDEHEERGMKATLLVTSQ